MELKVNQVQKVGSTSESSDRCAYVSVPSVGEPGRAIPGSPGVDGYPGQSGLPGTKGKCHWLDAMLALIDDAACR